MESREQINAVWQMQNYIEGHLDEPITLHALAKSAGYSPWHCARIFKELTGKAPFEYIRMYRLSKAAMELRDNDIKVVDVAMDFLFDSHEGFTRAFRRQFGMSPNEYKKIRRRFIFSSLVHTGILLLAQGYAGGCTAAFRGLFCTGAQFPQKKAAVKTRRVGG